MTVQAVASVFKDANILLGSKILAVAETIDSIASGRLLKVKLTVKQAIQNFTDDSRRRFDPNVVSYGHGEERSSI